MAIGVVHSASGRQTSHTRTAAVPVDQDAVSANWLERGFSCGLWTDSPGQIWRDFVHDTDEIVMVVEGEVEFEIGGEVHRPRLARSCSFPPGRATPSATWEDRVTLAVRLQAVKTQL